ncbi:MAG: superoxide dismutase family protein [Lachnospira sp.]|jgi:Cu-Zn family superoxide dismutase|nr:superoxide dismutase family protein [Lachnospira sp.]
MIPFACAKIKGNSAFSHLRGKATFYANPSSGVWIEVEVNGLPDAEGSPIDSGFYGLHIHENGNCDIPFDQTGEHYNPEEAPHPYHAGDLPPLLGSHGYAYSFFYTDRFSPEEIINKSIIIHSAPDDFTSQPSGNSGEKIGCGVIEKCGSY